MPFNIDKNLAQSSLASGYTAGNTSITVQTGDGAKFDAAPFVVAIDNPPAFFLKVTGVSGDTFTVDASGFDGSTPISETFGTQVTEVITAGVLSSLLADAGGTVPTSGWTAVNGVFYNDFRTPNSLGFLVQDASGLNWRFVQQSLSGGVPYEWIVTLRGQFSTVGSGAQSFGLFLTDGTKLIGFEVLLLPGTIANGLRVERMNSVNSDNGTVGGPTTIGGGLVSLKITNDGTHRTFYYYEAGAWTQLYQEATGAWLTETAIGVGGVSVVGNPTELFVTGEIVSWSLT